MSQTGCSYHERQMRGMRTITLANRFLSVTILPEKGGDIYSFEYLPAGVDVLWKSPWGLRRPGSAIATAPSSEVAWFDHYEGGWQQIFPNGGDACRYRGAELNFHGEASVVAWDWTVACQSSAEIVVAFTAELARSPFRLQRLVTIQHTLPALLIEDRVENRSEEDLHFMWGHHPAFGAPFLDGGCRLQIPARTFLAHDVEIASTCRIGAGARGSWPVLAGKSGQPIDLSVVPPAAERVTEFGYLCELDESWYGLSNDALGFGFGLAWEKAVFPYVWFWQELRGSFGYPWYGNCYVMAVEPFTSIPGVGLEKAIEWGTAPVLKAGGHLETRLAAMFYETGDVQSIDLEGNAKLRTRTSQGGAQP